MYGYIKQFIDIAIFRAKPQDLSASSETIAYAIVFGIITYILAGVNASGLAQSMLQAMLDMSVSVFFIYGVLIVQGKASRLKQTFSALVGSGAVVNLVASPIIFAMSPDNVFNGALSLILLLLFAWSLALCAFIFKAAFDLSHTRSIVFAALYVLIVVSLTQWVFPNTS